MKSTKEEEEEQLT